jgi:hypothetical protein
VTKSIWKYCPFVWFAELSHLVPVSLSRALLVTLPLLLAEAVTIQPVRAIATP